MNPMATIVYNKLVRDNIPEIIRNSDKICITEILDEKHYLQKLDEKLLEECAEYQNDKNLEELADILEVLYAITNARGYSLEELEQVRRNKAAEKGAFQDRILLKEVISK